MFHPKSFKKTSFSPSSWRFPDATTPPTAAIDSGPGADDGPRRFTDFTDDQLIELAVQLIISGVLDG